MHTGLSGTRALISLAHTRASARTEGLTGRQSRRRREVEEAHYRRPRGTTLQQVHVSS